VTVRSQSLRGGRRFDLELQPPLLEVCRSSAPLGRNRSLDLLEQGF
jgi:hypothetical protein